MGLEERWNGFGRESSILSSFNTDNPPATGYFTGQSSSLCVCLCVGFSFSRSVCVPCAAGLPGWEPPTSVRLSPPHSPARSLLVGEYPERRRSLRKNNKIGEFAFLPLFIHFSSALLCGGFFKKKKKGARNWSFSHSKQTVLPSVIKSTHADWLD
jgi:hypothetical protein